jgi:hypothetical protein
VSEHIPESRNAVQVHYMNNAGKRCLKLLLIFNDIRQASELISRDGTFHQAFAGHITAKMFVPMMWRLKKTSTRHTGHFRPRVPWHMRAPLTHQDQEAIATAKAAGLLSHHIASLWVTRAHWCRAFNMELGAFDTRTSTFVESQNAVLTEDVKVSASMNIRTMVQTESRVHQTKQRRLEHANFQRKIRPLSDTSGDHDESLELARKFLCPKPLKRMTRQVHLAKSCLRSSDHNL